MNNQCKTVKAVTLSESIFKQRYMVERNYLNQLKNDNLLQNYYIEAGIKSWYEKPRDIHWGWESPECQLRGHYLGHWLSAVAKMVHQINDVELRVKANLIIDELEKCQEVNGGQWVGSIPEKYLYWIEKGRDVWAPQYTLHKLLMGLIDMYRYTQNEKALKIADSFSDWFFDWTNQFNREEMDNILDYETGGLLEAWADLYEITKDEKYLSLVERYYRQRLFDKLLLNEDCLTDKHANTTIPEILGVARLWEVTGKEDYKKIAMNYYHQAVTERGYFCTGGQTNGESWTPKNEIGSRLGNANQEHCVVYNMIRLADYLLRWTGDKQYGDYIERNIYNGLFAQQNLKTGTALYYLSLLPNSKKEWGTLEEDFWCCYGTVAQAPTLYPELTYYECEEGLIISQFIPSKYSYIKGETKINLEQKYYQNRPSFLIPGTDEINFTIECEKTCVFNLRIRIPWWSNETKVKINGTDMIIDEVIQNGYLNLSREWLKDTVDVTFIKKLTFSPTPDMPYLSAFMYGPTVLAGLGDEKTLYTSSNTTAEELLRPININRWTNVMFYTKNQVENIRFIPLGDVLEERYSIYFPIECNS